MPQGVEVFVDEGFATIGVPDKAKRGEVLDKILTHTPPALVEKLTRSGPFVLYRIPEGNARAAGLVDGDGAPPTERKDLHFAAELVDADPQVSGRGGQHGEYRTPMAESTVKDIAYQAMPDGSNGVISGPLRPNKNVDPNPPTPPSLASTSASDLQAKIRANTPRPNDYAPARTPRDERVPAAVGTIAAVVGKKAESAVPVANGNGNYDDPIEWPEGEPSAKWGRDELDAYALHHKKLDTTDLPNKAAVVKAIKEA